VKLQNMLRWGAALSAAGLIFGASSPAARRRIRLARRFRPAYRSSLGPVLRPQPTDGNQHRASGQLDRRADLSERPVWPDGEQRPDRHDRDGAASNPSGASVDRDGWHGDAFTSSFTGVPFANGNTTVSLQRVVSIVVIPNLHVSATGSSLGGHGCGISTSSAGSDSFSDRLSITEAQLDAVNKAIGSHYGDIFVKLNISSQVR
jgi:hypothetical protein